MRKGRCSNDPKNCSLAEDKTQLPYAGIDSVCPECGSPLAALAPTVQPEPPPSATTVPLTPPPAAPIARTAPEPAYGHEETRRYERAESKQTYQNTRELSSENYDESRQQNSFMKLTQLMIVGAAIALLGFFTWRMFLQPRAVTAPDLAATAQVTGVAGQQVTQISPAQLRRVIVATQAFATPDPSGPMIAQLPVGSSLDVSGQIEVNGINWLRISLPNDSSKSGFVRADQMANLGDGNLSVDPLGPLPSISPPVSDVQNPSSPELVGPVEGRAPSTFYIASLQANIREEANVTSARVAAYEFSDPITVIGQRSVGPRMWYQVQLPGGGTGWINGRLVSTTLRDAPIDGAASTPKVVTPAVTPKPPSDTTLSDAGKADNQSALTALGQGANVRVDSTTANLRKEPGTAGNGVLEVLPRDTLVSVEDVRIVNGVPWYRVTSPSGTQGWLSGRTVVETK